MVVPMETDLGRLTLLIAIAVEGIFIECKITISPGIDSDLHIIPLLLGGILHIWSPRHDGASFDIKRDDVIRRLFIQPLSTFQCLTCPKVHPIIS